MRGWLGIALLAGSWLFGMPYFQTAHLVVWIVLVIAAASLLGDVTLRLPTRRPRMAAMLLLLIPIWWLAWPDKVIPILLAVGLGATLLPVARRWSRQVGRGALAAGLILFVQGTLLELYQIATARGHELPGALAGFLALALRLVGADAVLDGSWLAVATTNGTDRFAATWELLFDPATVCFLAGGLALSCVWNCRHGRGRQPISMWSRQALVLLVIVLIWAPLRAALIIGFVSQLATLADPILFPNIGRVLVNSWLHFGLLSMPMAAAMVLLRKPRRPSVDAAMPRARSPRAARRGRLVLGTSLVGFALLILGGVWSWTPIGHAKAGRVLVVERHSTWEPTIEPYATTTYGEAGSYTYAAAYAYCDQFYQMGRLLESDSIDDQSLGACDILIIKTPTARYSKKEVAAVVRFVQRGGSVLLVGDHTNVFNMNTYLNDISRHFGFTFRNDLLFKIGSPYAQAYVPPRVAHPILFHVPPMRFAVSCSIDPGASCGRMAIRNTGLYNLPPAYQESNYHPQAEYRTYMQYGAWCQLWATTYGRGRIAAFADSTLFSNFCVYQPGKRELLMGMLQWLNRSSTWDRLGLRATLIGFLGATALALIGTGVWLLLPLRGGWLLLVATGMTAWSLATWATMSAAHHAVPYPTPTRHRLPHVVIDRTLSDVPLFTGAFADDKEGNGYGLLEQWVPRIGNYTTRESGLGAFSGDAMVVICPTHLPSREYRQQLVDWVRAGGRLLVFDSPDVEDSTADSLLFLFGMSSRRPDLEPAEHPLEITGLEKPVPSLSTCEISGGTPLATWNGKVAAARVAFGKGTVTAVGFGSLFNDGAMGFHWLVEPEPDTMARYDALYTLLRAALPFKPATPGK